MKNMLALIQIVADWSNALVRVSTNCRIKLVTLILACLLPGLSSWGFTLFNSNTGSDPYGSVLSVPAAEVDAAPDADFSDCLNRPNDHWHWPIPASGPIVIYYAYDSTFDTLFANTQAGQATETAIKAQITLAMQQWSSAANASYGQFDSYARGNAQAPVTLDGLTDNFPQFMDVRSATLHELGHILGFAHCDQGAMANPPANFAYTDSQGHRGAGKAAGMLSPYADMQQVELANNPFVDAY